MDLSEFLNVLHRWLDGIHIPAKVLTDREDALRVVFETENALAELLAGDGEYAPYRHVSFTVLDTRLDMNTEPVFCFYDDESHTIGDILRELDRGLGFLKER